MDHRLSPRQVIFLDVMLYPHGRLPLKGSTRDLSHSGVYVSMDRKKLLKNSFVDIEFDSDSREEERYHFEAIVIRSEPQGIGLMFGDLDQSHERILAALMKKTQ